MKFNDSREAVTYMVQNSRPGEVCIVNHLWDKAHHVYQLEDAIGLLELTGEYHEVLSGTCCFYMDIEYYRESYDPNPFDRILASVKSLFPGKRLAICQNFRGTPLKHSYHLVVPDAIFDCGKSIRRFIQVAESLGNSDQ